MRVLGILFQCMSSPTCNNYTCLLEMNSFLIANTPDIRLTVHVIKIEPQFIAIYSVNMQLT